MTNCAGGGQGSASSGAVLGAEDGKVGVADWKLSIAE